MPAAGFATAADRSDFAERGAVQLDSTPGGSPPAPRYRRATASPTASPRTAKSDKDSHLGFTAGQEEGLSLFQATAALAQNMMGSGMLAMPYAFSRAGAAGAPVLLAAVMALSFATMCVLAALSDQLGGVFTFKEVAALVGSPAAGTAVEALIFSYNIAICIGYCVFVGDFLSNLLRQHAAWGGGEHHLSTRACMVIVTVLCFWPLACARTLSKIAPLAVVGVAGVLFSSAVVVVRYADGRYDTNASDPDYPDRVHMDSLDLSQIGDCFPILVVSFGCHFNILSFYQELEDRSPRRMAAVILGALLLSGAVYALVGLVGYATFGPCTRGDFTESYDDGDPLVVAVRALMLFVICVSFPLVMLSARATADSLCLAPRGVEMTALRRVLLSTALTAVCLAVAVAAAGNAAVVLDYNGSLLGTPVCFVCPSVLYLMLPRENQGSVLRCLYLVCAVLGVAFSVFGAYSVTTELVHGTRRDCDTAG